MFRETHANPTFRENNSQITKPSETPSIQMLIIAEPTKFCAIEMSEMNLETTAPEVVRSKNDTKVGAYVCSVHSAVRKSSDDPPCSPSSCGSRSQSPEPRTARRAPPSKLR